MRAGILGTVVAAWVWGLFFAGAAQPRTNLRGGDRAGPAETPRPVLVELFTSEGCSSCPPADRLLIELQKSQPVPGVQIIALSEHVDYWNRLGWADPFSSPDFSARQAGYAAIFQQDGVYTPQMVVHGRAEFVGSDRAKALRAITDAASAPAAAVRLEKIDDPRRHEPDAGSVRVTVEDLSAAAPDGPVVVWLAIVEDGISSHVARGENAGRRLPHAAVVRSLTSIGKLNPAKDKSFSAEPLYKLRQEWKRQNLRMIVFLQEQRARRVLGAATLPL